MTGFKESLSEKNEAKKLEQEQNQFKVNVATNWQVTKFVSLSV